MSEQMEVTKHYDKFMDLAEPLFTSYLLENEECNVLFWHSFHPNDCLLLLHRLLPRLPDRPPIKYFSLKEVFLSACDTFSQKPGKLLCECQQASKWLTELRWCKDNWCDPARRPSISKYQAQVIVQDLEAKVTHHRKLALSCSPYPASPTSAHVVVPCSQSLPSLPSSLSTMPAFLPSLPISSQFSATSRSPSLPASTTSVHIVAHVHRPCLLPSPPSPPASPVSDHNVTHRPHLSPTPPAPLMSVRVVKHCPIASPAPPSSSASGHVTAPHGPCSLPQCSLVNPILTLSPPQVSPLILSHHPLPAVPLPRILDSSPVPTPLSPYSSPLPSPPPDQNACTASALDNM
jgi:hypothetical protein